MALNRDATMNTLHGVVRAHTREGLANSIDVSFDTEVLRLTMDGNEIVFAVGVRRLYRDNLRIFL